MLSKAQLIEAICDVNRSARSDWLRLFDVHALRAYFDHLQLTLEPRGPHSAWIRRAETSAVVTRRRTRR